MKKKAILNTRKEREEIVQNAIRKINEIILNNYTMQNK
jgi:hypothetical protein